MKPKQITLEGRMMPADRETERAVIGSLLMEKDAYLKVSDIIAALDFYIEQNAVIFESIQYLFANSIPIDIISVMNDLRRREKLDVAGGAYYLTECTSKVASAAHIEHHASIILELSMRRELINRSETIVSSAYNASDNFDSIILSASNLLDSVLRKSENKAIILDFKDNMDRCIDSIKERQKNILNPSKNKRCTELTDLRYLISAYEGGNLIVIAGRPGMGKTDIAVNEACELTYKGMPVLIFSLEMTATELTNRVFQRETGLSKYDFERPMDTWHWEQLGGAYEFLQQKGIFIDDTPLASFSHIKSKSKIYKQMHGIQAIFIDYLQLIRADNRLPREQQVAEITRNLKALAKELDVPVFLLAQLNREVEKRSDKKPILADLRESGAIEQDADIIIFPTRPEYYWPMDNELKGIAIIDVAKNRSGKTGEVIVRVNETVTKFSNKNSTEKPF